MDRRAEGDPGSPPDGRERHALGLFAMGFLIEAGTEAYQLVGLSEVGALASALYFLSLATTVLGFYVMYRAARSWRPARGSIPRQTHGPTLPVLARIALAALVATGGFLVVGELAIGSAAFWFALLVATLTVLAFAGFFTGLYRIGAERAGARLRAALAAAVGWSIVVATYSGVLLGQKSLLLIRELFTNVPGLFTTFAPIARAMAALIATYGILGTVFLRLRQRVAASAPSPESPPRGTS
ncbi:MAG: hypothetical protein L3K07_04730 [Thermoplasmata archaeon]|nr:hypothetical protein [Thermoplasmata archaeon]